MQKELRDCKVGDQFTDKDGKSWQVIEKISRPLIVRLSFKGHDHIGKEALVYDHPQYGLCCMDQEFIGVKMIKGMPGFSGLLEVVEPESASSVAAA